MVARAIIYLVITFVIFNFAGVISILDKLFSGFRPVIYKLRNDLRQLQPELKSWAMENLIKWDRQELELLSLRQHRQFKKTMRFKITRGVFQSIYHEPLVVYTQKMYNPMEGVLIVRNSEHEFAYIIHHKEVEVFIDEEYYGKLDAQGKLWYNQKNVIATVDRGEGILLEIKVNNKIAGNLLNEIKKESRNPRAFQYVAELDAVEEKVFLSMAFFEIIRRSPKK